MLDLLNYRKDIYSQNGEDGIIEKILELTNIKEGYFVEFGAWDGKHLSNTYNLLKNKNWKGVYIESDKSKFNDCVVNMQKYGNNIQVFNKAVSHIIDSPDSLDNILKDSFLPKDFDLLSIDIDSYDYQVWESFKNYNPKIVIIEIHSECGAEFCIYNPKTGDTTSYGSMIALGQSKGYKPLCHCGNIIFLRNDISFPEVDCYHMYRKSFKD